VLILFSAAIVAAALWWVGSAVARQIAHAREELARRRVLDLMALFAPGMTAAADDSRAILTWQPLAATARKIFSADFAALDQATGKRFPFSADDIEAAHARWSADWLAWERTHDAEYKLKAAEVEVELEQGAPNGRARLDAVEREKLELYQRKYADYVRVSKALQALRTGGL
jgi:hypothetical protein